MELPAFLELLSGAQAYQGGYNARCPAHDDGHASLSVGLGEHGKILVNCHAGCAFEDVVKALGLTLDDLAGRPHKIAEYHYTDSAGRILWTMERWEPGKKFRARPGLPPREQRVLFARDSIEKARANNQPIYMVEGEKDAISAHERNLAATTCTGGSSGWLDHYAAELAGLHVIVVADNDRPGKDHARKVGKALEGIAASVRLAKPRAGKDLTDHFDLGFSIDQLDPLEQDGTQIYYWAKDLVAEPIRWAWPNRIALGALTLIDGDPGDGKSVLTCDLAARWSSGLKMPDGSDNPLGGPATVVMVSAEDDLAATVIPRLYAHGADMSRIACINCGPREDIPFSLGEHLTGLGLLLGKEQVQILILDPLMAYLPDGTDSSGDSSVRRALAPLMLMARRYNIAIIVVRHLNKNGTGKALYRGGGSIAFSGMARAAYMVTRHPDDENARVFAAVKNNLAPLGSSLVYRLSSDPKFGVARLDWEGEVNAGAQELLDSVPGDVPAGELTRFLLETCVNPLPWREIVSKGRSEGYTESSLRAARSRVLEKVMGHNGNRDATWRARYGYSPAPLGGLRLLPTCEPTGKTTCEPGNDAVTSTNTASENPLGHSGAEPVMNNASGVAGDDTPPTRSEAMDAALDAAGSDCELCGQPGVKFYEPWGVVRCIPHNPMTYTAG